MTFDHYQPVYRDEEATDRFCGHHFHLKPPIQRAFRFAVCSACIEEDERPYLRTTWFIGWMGVCVTHQMPLLTHCQHCHQSFRTGSFSSQAPFSPDRCRACSSPIRSNTDLQADSSAFVLQQTLLAAKTNGYAQLSGIGHILWRDLFALIDILMGALWNSTTRDERTNSMWLYAKALGDDPGGRDLYCSRHDSLRFIAWLLDGWPYGVGPQVAQEMLRRWFRSKRDFVSSHLSTEWVGKSGAHNCAISAEQRARILELYRDLLRANPGKTTAVRKAIQTRMVWVAGRYEFQF